MFDAEIVNVDIEKHRENVEDIPDYAVYDSAKAARKILKGVSKNRGIIIFPHYAHLSYWLERIHPSIMNITRRVVIKSLRDIRL
jgi:hypothetical protein